MSILDEAAKIVAGRRQEEYGPPEDSFERIGTVWGALLKREALTPRLVALMLAAMKIVRDTHFAKRDNLVDLAGYALCADMVSGSIGKCGRCGIRLQGSYIDHEENCPDPTWNKSSTKEVFFKRTV